MATLIRRGSTYSSVPGYTQPNPITSVGGSPASGDTFGGLATNKYTFWNASNMPNPGMIYNQSYVVTAPSRDYAQFEKEYYIDSRTFGMLGTGYGAAARYAASPEGFKEMYGANTTGNNRLGLDYDFVNKSMEPWSMGWARKNYQTMERAYNEGIPAKEYSYTSSPFERHTGSGWVDMDPRRDKGGNKLNYTNASALQGLGWNMDQDVAQYVRSRYSDNTVGRFEQFAPTSISAGRGLFTGPQFSLSGQYNASLTRQLLEQVRSRWS